MRKLFLGLSIFLLLPLTGCRETNKQKAEPSAVTAVSMPEVKPDDFAFSIAFGYGTTNKNEINTFEHTVTKDLVTKGTATATLTLTNDEMQLIYERMREINVLKELKLETASSGCSTTPYSEDRWEVLINGVERNFEWSSEKCELTDDAQQLKELRDYIFERVSTKKEYIELPEAVGGYD
ncbi:hypothetical protein H1230_10025 [Paenibacillus sp. 19GGS1-52]|nr:hypothetical protein H1230_10025 [Paenibacillus sp. 19GGS1-52]